MKKISITIFSFLSMALAKKAESFEQAKTLSADLGIPILLEFVHED